MNNDLVRPLVTNSTHVSLPQPDILRQKIETLLTTSREVIDDPKYKNTKNFYYFNPQELLFQKAAYTYVPYLDEKDQVIFEARLHVISLLNQFFLQFYPTASKTDYITSKIPALIGKLHHHFPKHVELKDHYNIPFGTLILERLITLAEYHLWKASPPHPSTLPADTLKTIQEGCEDNYDNHLLITRESKRLVEIFGKILTIVKNQIEKDPSNLISRFEVGILWELQGSCENLITSAGTLAWEVFEHNKIKSSVTYVLNTPVENEIRQHMQKRRVEIEEILTKRTKK